MEPMNSTGRVTPEEAAIAACHACRAAVNECKSRAAADGEDRSRRVSRRSGAICGDNWHRACGLEKEEAR
eukprot:4067568-Pleurochrysis_carterae.AAC.1